MLILFGDLLLVLWLAVVGVGLHVALVCCCFDIVDFWAFCLCG